MKHVKRILLFLIVFASVCVFGTKAQAQGMKECTAHISDPEFAGIIEESMGNIVEDRANSRSLNVTVAAARRYTTVYFDVNSGRSIQINATLSKSGNVGIIDADGYVRYVTGTRINHTFAISQTNAYCVFVQNLNSVSITATGSYSWN